MVRRLCVPRVNELNDDCFVRLIIGILQATTVLLLVLLGHQRELTHVYFVGVAAAAGLFVHQQKLIKKRDGPGCMRAFTNNAWVGAAFFAGVVGDYALRGALE